MTKKQATAPGTTGDLLTSAQIAAQVNCHKSTIDRHAAAHSIGRIFGTTRVFTADEAAKVKSLVKSRGNPNMSLSSETASEMGKAAAKARWKRVRKERTEEAAEAAKKRVKKKAKK